MASCRALLLFVSYPVAYLAFLVGVVAAVGLMGMLLPKPREGTCRVFRDANFFRFRIHWCLERYVPRPLITHIQLLTGLRTIYFRMMGARLSWSTHLSPGCQLWGPSMIRLGHLTYVGDSTHLASHLNQGDKLLVAPIVLGDRCNVGAQVHVGPGCSFGSDVRIGALSDIAPGCWIEDSVELGPCCQLGMGVKIGAGSRIEPRSFLDSWTAVPAGEIWGGDPARKLGDVEQTAGSRRKERRRAGGS